MPIASCMFGRGGGRGEVGLEEMLEDGTVPARRAEPVLYHDRYERRAGMEHGEDAFVWDKASQDVEIVESPWQ